MVSLIGFPRHNHFTLWNRAFWLFMLGCGFPLFPVSVSTGVKGFPVSLPTGKRETTPAISDIETGRDLLLLFGSFQVL